MITIKLNFSAFQGISNDMKDADVVGGPSNQLPDQCPTKALAIVYHFVSQIFT